MKTYTEKEVDDLLKSQIDNCWVALNYLTKDEKLLKAVIDSPEPGKWRDKKQYFIIFNGIFMIDISQLPVNSEKEIKDILQEIHIQPLQFGEIEPAKEIKTEVEISKETAEFLKNNCNIERNNYGEDTYILNNLRFKIEER